MAAVGAVSKFEQALAYAVRFNSSGPHCASHAERWMAENLSLPLPCGMEEPPVVSFGNGECGVLVDDRGDALTVEEARGYAAAILRAADEAEARNR